MKDVQHWLQMLSVNDFGMFTNFMRLDQIFQCI